MNLAGGFWPRLAALGVLAVGMAGYIRNYPVAGSGRLPGNGAEVDTLISAFSHLPRAGSISSPADTAAFRNPFQARIQTGSAPGAHSVHPPSPVRRWKLKGTAGNSVATLLDSAGVKHLMRVGDTAGGVRVLEVHPSHVSMQDEAGRFELGLEK